MTREPESGEQEPRGGRAAERLRDFFRRRQPPDAAPPDEEQTERDSADADDRPKEPPAE
jgi:hypothetical protein